MRRRPPPPPVSIVDGSEVPVSVLEFVPSEWRSACGCDYHDWEAWEEAREEWARKNLPYGVDSLPEWEGEIPEQPWAEVLPLI